MGSGKSWRDVFTRSRASHLAFRARPEFEGPIWHFVESNELPIRDWINMFSPAYRSALLLDGIVVGLRNYGFPAGRLQDGTWVIGYKPTRLLCDYCGASQPRRLHGESQPTSPDDLRAMFREQLGVPADRVRERLDELRAASTSADLVRLAGLMFPTTPEDVRASGMEVISSPIAPLVDRRLKG